MTYAEWIIKIIVLLVSCKSCHFSRRYAQNINFPVTFTFALFVLELL